MSTQSTIINYVVEVPKDDVQRSLAGFSPYGPSLASLDAVGEALAAGDSDLTAIQLAHYWLITDCWIHQHNREVEEVERARKEVVDLLKAEEKKKKKKKKKKKEIEEDRRRRVKQEEKKKKKKKEIEEDWRQRVKQEEKEKRRKEKGKGKEVVSEAGLSNPWKRKATEEADSAATKKPKVSVPELQNETDSFAV